MTAPSEPVRPLLVVATHPTQFLAPWARYLHQRLERDGDRLEVWYATLPDNQLRGVGFGQSVAWDTDLLSGYSWTHIGNRAASPSLDKFSGTRVGQLRSRLRALNPSAVLVTGWHQLSLLQVAIACRLMGIPCLVRAEASALKPRSATNRRLHRWLLKLFERRLAIGISNRDYYLGLGAAPSTLEFSPYFVDNDWLRNQVMGSSALCDQWRQTRNIAPDCRIILFVGKLQAKKRPMDLLEAGDQLRGMGYDKFLIVLAGDGELRAALEKRATALNLPVHFTGFVNQSELPGLYSAADCLVLPSSYEETWGLVVNEAMNFSLPVVVSDEVGCGPDLVIDDETGYRFPVGTTAALATAIARLLAEPELRLRLGEAGSKRVSRYSIEAASDGLAAAWAACRGAD